jgi:hypothetical protein
MLAEPGLVVEVREHRLGRSCYTGCGLFCGASSARLLLHGK